MKGMKSLYWRNLTSVMSILLISHILLAIVFSAFMYSNIIRDKKDNLEATTMDVASIVSAYSTSWDIDGLNMRMAISSFADTTGFDILIIDRSGECVSCSDRQITCEHIGRKMSPLILATLQSSGDRVVSGRGTLDNFLDSKNYYAVKAVSDFLFGGTRAYVLLIVNAGYLNNIWSEFFFLYIMVSVVVILIAFVVTRRVTRLQTMPIDEMASAARKFAHGDYSVRVSEPERRDEIGELADAFNVMAQSIEESEARRREFVANVSHELKTPMTTITGFADGILDGTIARENEDEYLAMISAEAKRLSRLVRGMLDASRAQEFDTKEILSKSFNIVEVVSLAILSLEKKITDKGLDVEVELPEDAIMVRGDSDTIMQVVYNLLDNAAKFSKPSSALRVSVWKEKGKAYVSVGNEGATIPPEEITVIFDRFHKTDKSRSMDKDGVGLGLYIVKTILDRHGEDIFVKSENGYTEFTFTMTPAPTKREKPDKSEKSEKTEEIVPKKEKPERKNPMKGIINFNIIKKKEPPKENREEEKQ